MASVKDWAPVEGVILSYDRIIARGTVQVFGEKVLSFAGTCFYGVRGQKRPLPGDEVTVLCREEEPRTVILAVLQQRKRPSGRGLEVEKIGEGSHPTQ